MTDERRAVTYAEALALLPEGDYVHTFLNPAPGLMVGADWPADEARARLALCDEISLSGPAARATGHGLVFVEKNYGPAHYVFVETDAERLDKFDPEEA